MRNGPRASPSGHPFSSAQRSTHHALRIKIGRLFRRERTGELDQHRAQMRAVAEEVRRAAAAGEQKCDRREISLCRITQLAGKDEIVAPIVGCLAAAGRHMVERHRRFGESLAAVGADRTMSSQEPASCFRIGDTAGRMRGQLDRAVRYTTLRALLSSSRAPASMRAGPFVIEHFLVHPMRMGARGGGSMMLMRRAARSGTGAVLLLWPVVAVGRVVKMSRQTKCEWSKRTAEAWTSI